MNLNTMLLATDCILNIPRQVMQEHGGYRVFLCPSQASLQDKYEKCLSRMPGILKRHRNKSGRIDCFATMERGYLDTVYAYKYTRKDAFDEFLREVKAA